MPAPTIRPRPRIDGRVVALVVSLLLHAGVLALAGQAPFRALRQPQAPRPDKMVIFLQALPPPPVHVAEPAPRPVHAAAPSRARPVPRMAMTSAGSRASPERAPARLEAPPAPTAQDWALAASYTLKNSKRYRYTWGQQVRSMMGTAVEGPDEGAVRFRIEIAADGTVARVETLWTTSDTAERLARKAIAKLPPLPPTPTGRPLVFERTISFDPFAADAPPIYANDCVPDAPAFQDPFPWDGKSPQVRAEPQPAQQPDPQERQECLRQLAQDSIDAESAHDQRQFDRWGSSALGR